MHSPLGLTLREIRASRGLSLREAASQTGVDRDTIREIELGERHPFARTLGKLAEGYGVPLRELLELEEPAQETAAAAVPLAKAPEGRSGSLVSHEDLDAWLEGHGARCALMSDEEILDNFERLAVGSDRQP